MADNFELTDEMKAQIGKKTPPWTFEVTSTSVRAFARGVGYTDPVYYDLDAAKKAGYRNLPAPPTYLGTAVFIPGKSDDTFSRPLHKAPKVNHGLKNILDGGTEIEYFRDICAGDTLSAVIKLSGLKIKKSKLLGKMLIIRTETRYTNSDGEIVAIQKRHTIFY